MPSVTRAWHFMTGEPIDAALAARIRLVDHVAPSHAVLASAGRFARRLARRPHRVLRQAKSVLGGLSEPDLAEDHGHPGTAGGCEGGGVRAHACLRENLPRASAGPARLGHAYLAAMASSRSATWAKNTA
jgi:hypothetical protein